MSYLEGWVKNKQEPALPEKEWAHLEIGEIVEEGAASFFSVNHF